MTDPSHPNAAPAPVHHAVPEVPARAAEADTREPALPGVATPNAELTRELSTATEAHGPGYVPRTEHLLPGGAPAYTNRLIHESSPYLLQHAHNPVNWHPWGPEALAKARALDRPIFLSIGYSTCHWCHVMERESFEDEEIAAYLNQHYVAIKVDREERPDLDDLYMRAVQMMRQRGGWPMTTVLTPDGQPFFAGTYFPPRDGVRGARQGLLSILRELVNRYETDRQGLLAMAAEVSARLVQASQPAPPGDVPSLSVVETAVQQLASTYDGTLGGFGRAPKFPQPTRVQLMLDDGHRRGTEASTRMAADTLRAMANGGLYDHVGGGFHRYSTDARWLVPHFEKMLYDNAQLVDAYLDGFAATGDPQFAQVAREVLDYVIREMTDPRGLFYSATDADSLTPSGHLEEGWFFTWTPAELRAALPAERARLVERRYGVTEGGNFEGRSIFFAATPLETLASEAGTGPDALTRTLRESLDVLYRVRSERPAPLRDDKIVAAWNGMMIHAFARAGWLLGDASYVTRARTAADALLAHQRDRAGRLYRTTMNGRGQQRGFLDDYAGLIEALLTLTEASGDARYLTAATTLQATLDAEYLDVANGGYFQSPRDGERLLARDKPSSDNAVPSGNSVAALNLLRLAALTGQADYRERAERVFASQATDMTRYPIAFPRMLLALGAYHARFLEVAVVGPPGAERDALLAVLRRTPSRARVVLVGDDAQLGALAASVPWLADKHAQQGRPTAYVCERGRCELPTRDASVLAQQLGVLRGPPSTGPASP
ncbi:MAG: thioredoxin domain-containing protein [Sandaracinaceae bacterium]|nr:thioredoxin domain-containing protein [Sandaracinaceae bacterium]